MAPDSASAGVSLEQNRSPSHEEAWDLGDISSE